MGVPTLSRSSLARLVEATGDRRVEPDIEWVSGLTERSPVEVRRVLTELSAHEEIERAIRQAHRAGGRDFYAQICAPFELYALVRLAGPQEIVETGVSSGVSSAHFLLGLRANGRGRLHSIDLPAPQRGPSLGRGESPVSLPPGRAPGWAVPAELRAGWDLTLGPSERLLPTLVRRLPRVDVFLHDDLHTPSHLTFELETIRPKLRPGAIVLADNTNWTGQAFHRFGRSIGAPVVKRRESELVGLRVPAAGSGADGHGRPQPAGARRRR